MHLFSLLNSIPIPVFHEGLDVSLDFLGKIVQWIVDGVGIVGVGIILFTLLIKTIVLPLDIYQKVTMRKQSLKMEAMRPQLEKLQKQYANDQALYNQKMMELYKQNNYSLFSACIPSLVTLVVFMFVLSAFNSYSQYTNLHAYNNMIEAYNASILQYAVTLEEQDGRYYVTGDYTAEVVEGEDGLSYVQFISNEGDKFIYIEVGQHYVTDNSFASTTENVIYYIDTDKMLQNETIASEVAALQADKETNGELSQEESCLLWVKHQARSAAAISFEENQVGFLWIKNIWYSDTMFAHPVQDYQSLIASVNKKVTVDGKDYSIKDYPGSPYATSAVYEEITYNLDEQKSQPNGYFVLIVLSVGAMFLAQFVMSRMNKAQNELQTANGQGASTMKMMMIIMPIIYGFFSFSYSASFSIYMVTGSIYGLLTSLVTSKLVEWRFRKAEERSLQEKYSKRINVIQKKK